jgi:hypothetical protein
MIVIHTHKKIVVQYQISDFEEDGRGRTEIHLTWDHETLRGLFKYLKRILGGVQRKLRGNRGIKADILPLERYFEQFASVVEVDKGENTLRERNGPYRVTDDVRISVLQIQGKDLTAGVRKVATQVTEITGQSISYETVREIVNASPLGKAKSFFEKIVDRIRPSKQELTKESVAGDLTNDVRNCEALTIKSRLSQREEFLQVAKTGVVSRYASLLILVAYFSQTGFYEYAEEFNSGKKKGFSDLELFLTTFYAPFVDCTRFEHFDYISSSEFAPLIAKNAVPRADCLREYIKRIATTSNFDKRIRTLYQGWTQLGLIDGRIGYVDEHKIEYCGAKALEKTKHGVKSRIVKATVEYYVSDGITENPIVCQFKPAIVKLSTVIPELVDLTKTITGRDLEILVFDRGGNSFTVFQRFQNGNTYYIAWAKKNYVALKVLKDETTKNFISIDEAVNQTNQRRLEAAKKEGGGKKTLGALFVAALPDDYIMNYVKRIKKKLVRPSLLLEGVKVFSALWDTEIPVKGVGKIRVIVGRRPDETEAFIYTIVPKREATALEVLLLLTRRQRIENFFKIKKGDLAADILGGWPTSSVTISKFKGKSKDSALPLEEKLRKTLNKRNREIQKYEAKLKSHKSLYDEEFLDKYELKSLINKINGRLQKKSEEIIVLENQLEKIAKGEIGELMFPVKVVERLNPERALFLNSLRDLLFVCTRLLCQDLARLLIEGDERINSKTKINRSREFKRLTPARVKHLLLQQGSNVNLSPDGSTLHIQLNSPRDDYWLTLLPRLCTSLNAKNPRLKLGRGVKFHLQYSVLQP